MIELSFWQTVIPVSVFEFLLPRFGSVIKVSLLPVDEVCGEPDFVRIPSGRISRVSPVSIS